MEISKDLTKIFTQDPLYHTYDLNEFSDPEIINTLFYLENSNFYDYIKTIDSYCVKCNKDTTFISRNTDNVLLKQFGTLIKSDNKRSTLINYLNQIGAIVRSFKCPRCLNSKLHDLFFIFKVDGDKLIKIGQYPSIADLSNPETIKYKKINKEIYQELNRAIGLASHGIGIGSFVYLRRIIEKYILKPELDGLIKDESILESDVIKADFKAKINLAKDHIPSFLANNKKIYLILSKGIHELSESDCLEYFDILRNSIEIILDEKIEKIEKTRKSRIVKEGLDKI